jgi:hypothetical protein
LANDTPSKLNFIHKHYRNLQEMLEMASCLKYVDLYLTCEWGRFYVGHPLQADISKQKPSKLLLNSTRFVRYRWYHTRVSPL